MHPELERRPARLSATQLVASTIAAVAAAVISSLFGVAGTAVGAAVGSVVATLGGVAVAQSIHRARRHFRQRPRSAAIALACGVVFLGAVAALTGVEAATREPISALVGGHGQHGQHGRTTIGALVPAPGTGERVSPATGGGPSPADASAPQQQSRVAAPSPAAPTPTPTPSHSGRIRLPLPH
jgi:hypothetical protein